jgi:hypothetical protein
MQRSRYENKPEPFLGNGSVNTFRSYRHERNNGTDERSFLYGPCRDDISGTVWGNQLVARVLS